MTIQIEIVNVSTPVFVKTAKGGYNQIEVAYKQDGKVTGKKLLDFASPQAYNGLKGAASGSVFLVETSKNAAGYIQWDQVSSSGVSSGNTGDAQGSAGPSEQGAGPVNAGVSSGRGTGFAGKAMGSTYETPEERAVRQSIIVRQAAVNTAIEFHKTQTTEESPTLDEVLSTSRKLVTFYLDGLNELASTYKSVTKGI